jgi:hypothetical protein
MNDVVSIGAKARAALAASGGLARPLAAFPDAPYFDAGGEIIWVGSRLPARHPRAVLTATPVPHGAEAFFGALPGEAWRRALPECAEASVVVASCARLVASIDSLGAPRGFGTLLVGRLPAFPLDLAVERVRALARAYRAGDPRAVYRASRALLGFGTGLTPSGDDLVGAALFGRLLVSRDPHWPEVGARLAADAATASHAISAALLADLVAGSSFESLHALADALAAGDDEAALAAGGNLAALGHSSGWDMLAGIVIGIVADVAGGKREEGKAKSENRSAA